MNQSDWVEARKEFVSKEEMKARLDILKMVGDPRQIGTLGITWNSTIDWIKKIV